MKFDLPQEKSSIIKVIGVGGGGSNAVNHMFNQGIKGVEFVICNTDQQALEVSPVPTKIQLGYSLTEGRGAGSIPEVGKNAAIENIDELKSVLAESTKMVFITAGMGGGTGTGAAPIIAEAAREMGILTVGIVTIPFAFEGRKRKQQAQLGIEEMRKSVDTLIIICNDRLREIYGNLSITDAFSHADDVLATAAKGIAEIITVTGSMNVDFEDIRTVMSDSGVAIMGSSRATGESRATHAIEQALSSPLLNDNNIEGANYVLLNITYGKQEIQMDEVVDITDYIQDAAGSSADVIWGHGYDEALEDEICVTIIATGFKSNPDFGYALEKAPEKKIMRLDDALPNRQTSTNNPPIKRHTLEDEAPKTKTPNTAGNQTNKNVAEPYLKSDSNNESKSTEQKPWEEQQKKTQRVIEFDIDESENKSSTTNNEYEPYLKNEDSYQAPAENNTAPSSEEIQERNQESDLTQEEQQNLIKERIARLKKLSMKLKAPNGLSELENEPAYKRRQIDLDEIPHSSESSVSRYTLSEERDPTNGEKKYNIKPNNSFLHDNVD